MEFYDPHRYPRQMYDVESYHATWHPDQLIRERELEELSIASHELDLELHHLHLERERTMALHDSAHRFAHTTAGMDPGYGLLEPYTMGYPGVYPSYPPIPVVNDPLYRPPVPLVVNDLLYRSSVPLMTDPICPPTTFPLPPRGVPMMDPYFLNTAIPNAAAAPFPINSMRNPFIYGIDHDYGYGPIKPLAQCGLAPTVLQPDYGRVLDDLYLYETLLRLDRTLDEKERLVRWQERLAWEQLSQAERQLLWEQMDMMERNRLGLGPGSRWGYEIGGVPINTNFGYLNPALGMEVMESYRPFGVHAPIMGVCGHPHYPIPPTLLSQYPMWDVGGLGLGARISTWINELGCITPKDLIRRENMLRDYAERRGEIPPGPRIVEPHSPYLY